MTHDLVIPVRQGDSNEELRHSLRSMAANLPHRNLWLIGHRPRWATGCWNLVTRQDGTKYANSTKAMREACTNDSISDPFILSNDDFYAMKPVDGPPPWHRGPVVDVMRRYERRPGGFMYREGMRQTYELLCEMGYLNPLSYELHVPLLIHKDVMLEALDMGEHIPVLHKRTVYGNLAGLGGEQHGDVKILKPTQSVPTGQAWLSSSDQSWQGRIGQVIRQAFPWPSRYE